MSTGKVVQILSDLHLEFNPQRVGSFIWDLDPTGVDILVLAGDICSEPMLEDVLGGFCAKYPQVVFVAGNHEYYGAHTLRVTEHLIRLQAKIPNLTWLDNKVAIVDDVRFAGGTMWFARPTDPEMVRQARWGINDFSRIGTFESWVYDENARCTALLRAAAPTVDVVVTHHIPTPLGVAPQYAGNPMNHYFCHDMTPTIERAQPKVWFYGHTHSRHWNRIGRTLLVCNPKGYPRESCDGRHVAKCLVRVDRDGATFVSEPPGRDTPGWE